LTGILSLGIILCVPHANANCHSAKGCAMQVLFDFANHRVVVDGEGQELVSLFSLIRDIAPQLPSITFTSTGSVPPPPHGSGSGSGVPSGASSGSGGANTNGGSSGDSPPPGMKQFVKDLSLGSISEKICAIAYYQATYMGKDTFSPREMDMWFTHAGQEKPSQMSVGIFDARKRHGYVESAGHGIWRLSTPGENLIIRKMQDPVAG
jgi:hypothetical protein